MNDLISIIIPVKNGSNYIKEAIEGIKKQNMNVEIIVADDCSTDNTAKIAASLGCIVIKHEKQKGQVAGKNTGIKAAKGKYIIFHDHDDVMNEGALNRLYDELSASEEYVAVEGKVKDFYTPGMSEDEKAKTIIKEEPYWGLFTGAILMKKELFDIIGLFDENKYTGEIIEWQSKIDENGLKIKKIDFVAQNRRVHMTNFGKTNIHTEFKNYAAILRAKLKRD